MARAGTMGISARIREGIAGRGWGRPHPPALLVAAALLCLACVFAICRFWPRGSDDPGFHTTAESEQSITADAISMAEDGKAPLVVDVTGQVTAPGVYTLEEGSRVIDAVAAAGGVLDDAETSSVNLARKLVDGEQVRIPSTSEAPSAVVYGSSSDAPGALVDINTADVDTLCMLEGIGQTTARKIVDDRTKNGPFANKEDIMRVSGIGEGRYAAIEDHIRV